MRQALSLARVFVRRDLAVDLTYKTALALEALDVAIGAAAFYYFAQVLGDRRPDGYDAFAFLLVGIAVNNAMTTTLTCFTQAVQSDRQHGAIKPLAAAPIPPAAVLALSGIYPVLRGLGGAAACLAGGAVLGLSFAAGNVVTAVLVAAVATAAFAAIGMVSAVFTLVLKRGDPVLWMFGMASWLLGGVFFPVSVLPEPIQSLSALLPLTHALDAFRAALLDGAALAAVRQDLLILGGIAAAGLPLGVLGLTLATAHMRRTGSLAHV
jgi:ABC-2 type transport system permease protein